jgi:site-specific recombinase XerD
MASFILDKPNGDKDTFIFVLLSCWDGRLKYSTKEKVHPRLWDFALQRPKVPKNDRIAKARYLKINRIDDALEVLKTNCTINGDRLTKSLAIETISAVLDHKAPKRRMSFEAGAKQIIREMREGLLMTDKGKLYSKGTIKNYNQSLNALIDFSGTKRMSIEFNDVTLNTYHHFINYCNQKDWALNYTGQHLKNWKCLLREAFKKSWHKNRIYEFEDFKTLQEETFDIFLSEEELRVMIKKNLSYNREYDLARDWFIIGCYTALRVSDLKLLHTDMVSGGQIILANEKTDERVVLPVHPNVAAILKKWKGFPPPIAEQTINQKIKEVAQLCKIKGKVLYSVTQGGVRKDYYMQKWQMVSLHTARRSFITNARKNGIPDGIIMKLAGIRKAATLQRYDKLSSEEAAMIAKNHSFFNGK